MGRHKGVENMCKAASMLVTRIAVLICGTDSHEDIKRAHHLRDDMRGDFVPGEIYPDDGDYGRPPSEWRLHTDLPEKDWPEWYSEAEAEIACRDKLPEWWRTRKNLSLIGFTGLTSLPEGLTVGGGLSLIGCTGLTSLPEGLSVGGELDLSGCTGLTSLPEGLSVGGELDLSGCTGLTSLPEGLTVGGDLYLIGCTGLTDCEIPPGVKGAVYR
jgi:hypothetical protein